MKKILLILLTITMTISLFSQGVDDSTGMGIGLSNQTIDGANYQTIALMPELNLGFFGIGLNVDLRFTLTIDDEKPAFEIYQDDWIIEDGDWQDYLSLYLTKIAYIRLGNKNEDFYLKAGQFSRATLGNGSILSDYSNMLFMPEFRNFGLALDIDGNLFNFPYVGFESFIGNLAQMDVLGGRLYVRPFSFLTIPVVSNIEIAASGVVDNNPYLYYEVDLTDGSPDNDVLPEVDPVMIYGVDITVPFIDTPVFSMDVFGDKVFQKNSDALILGIRGDVISFIQYGIKYIDQKENYINNYFNASYDLNRTGNNLSIYNGEISADVEGIPAKKDMSANLGFQIPKLVYFDVELTGLLTMYETKAESALDAPQLYPSLKGSLHVDNELLKIFSADFFYLKNGLEDIQSIFDPTNAIIGGGLNYYSGNMVISFLVDIKYNGDSTVVDDASTPDVDESEVDKWITNTQIAVNFKL